MIIRQQIGRSVRLCMDSTKFDALGCSSGIVLLGIGSCFLPTLDEQMLPPLISLSAAM